MRVEQGIGTRLRDGAGCGRRQRHDHRTRRGSAGQNRGRPASAFPGVDVTEVVGDITTPAGREAALKACPDPDILINNAGGPPPGDFRNWTRDDWIKAIDANMLTPIELIKATVDGMMARKFGRIVNITSAAVKSPIDVLGLSNGARAGLTGFVAGIARKTVIANVTINGLLPGPFDTDRLRGPVAKMDAEKRGITVDQMLAERAKLNPAGRFGDPEEFGLPARSCAARKPALSPDKTSCSTAAPSPARSNGARHDLVRKPEVHFSG